MASEARTSLERLSVASLRRLVLACGFDTFDVVEKSDLVDRASKALQHKIAPETLLESLGVMPPARSPLPEPVLSSALAQGCERAINCENGISDAQRSSVVRLPAFLSDDDIDAIHSLARQVGEDGRSVSQVARYAGAWNTCYVSSRRAFTSQLPKLMNKLLRAACDADVAQKWDLLSSAKQPVNPRVIEYHTVRTHGSLPWAHHFDEGSLLVCCPSLEPAADSPCIRPALSEPCACYSVALGAQAHAPSSRCMQRSFVSVHARILRLGAGKGPSSRCMQRS